MRLLFVPEAQNGQRYNAVDIQKAVTSILKSIPLTDIEKSFQTLIDRANSCID